MNSLCARRAVFGLVITVLALAGCGGGGGGGSPFGDTPFDVNAGLRRYLTTARTVTMTGTASDRLGYTLTQTFTVGTAAAFPVTGATGSRLGIGWAFTTSDGFGFAYSETLYFDGTSLAMLGQANSDGTCDRVTANTALPRAATVGSSGALASATGLDGCLSTSTATGSATVTWSLESAGSFALLCFNSVFRDLANASQGSESQCVEIAPDGTLGTRARWSVAQPDVSGTFTLTVKNY